VLTILLFVARGVALGIFQAGFVYTPEVRHDTFHPMMLANR